MGVFRCHGVRLDSSGRRQRHVEALDRLARDIREANRALPAKGFVHQLEDQDVHPSFQFDAHDRMLIHDILPSSGRLMDELAIEIDPGLIITAEQKRSELALLMAEMAQIEVTGNLGSKIRGNGWRVLICWMPIRALFSLRPCLTFCPVVP